MRDFAAQFKESYRVLWLIAVGIVGDASSAEDVVQEAALIALKKVDQFAPGTNFTAWLGQIVRNVARNRRRSDRTRRMSVIEGAEMERAADSAAGEARPQGLDGGSRSADRSIDPRIVEALGSVGETARACLLLRTIGGMEYSQIAELLDVPEGTAMSHVHRTRRYLRDRLADLSPSSNPEASR